MRKIDHKALLLAISLCIAGTALTGCGGKEERQAKYLQKAQEYFDKGQYEKAKIEVKNALQIDQNSGEARYILAQLDENEHNWPQMFGNLNAAVEQNPKLVNARIKLAQLFVAANQLDKAKEQADAIDQLEPNNPDTMAIRATILAREQKPEEAIALAQKALALKPGHVAATGVLVGLYAENDPLKAEEVLKESIKQNPKVTELRLLLIKLYGKQNKSDEVVAVFNELIKEDPTNLLYPGQLANFYILSNKPADAEAVLRTTIDKNPDSDDAKLLLIEFLGKQQRPDDARKLLEQYSKANPDDYKLRSALGRVYALTGDPDQAIATYKVAIDKDVRSADAIDARNRMVEIYLSKNKRPEAEALIKEILSIESQNVEALLQRARLSIADNKLDDAIADTRAILKSSPDSTQALALQALAQERDGSANLALDAYKKLLEKDPKSLLALVGIARLQLEQNQLDDAEKHLNQARQIAGSDIEVARLLVNLYVRKKQWDKADEICDQLILNSASAPVGYHLKGLVSLQKGDTTAAIESFKRALDKEPRAIEPLQLLISAYVSNKQIDVATTYLEKHVAAYPDHIHAQELLGALYRQQGKLAQAEQVLDGVVNKYPTRISAYRELMAVYFAKKEPARVEPLLVSGLKANPGNPDLLSIQAQYFQSIGNKKAALDSYNKLLEVAPRSDIVKNNLAVLLIDDFESEENLRRAQTLTAGFADSNSPLLLDTLAWLQYKLKNYPQAISLLESALKKGDSPELRYHLGMAYLKNGNKDKAKEELTKATASNAKYTGRAEAETELKQL